MADDSVRGSGTVPAAYGVRVEGLGAPEGLALRGAEGWPAVHFTSELTDDALHRASEIREDGATIANPAATLLVDRTRSSVRVRSHRPVSEAELIHPCLWPVAAVFARWRGAETLHAGAFAGPASGGAWGVMAESGAGKTSMLATLALAGLDILVDDLLVLEGAECLAGPRLIDLRPDVLDQLDLEGRVTTSVRVTSRERLSLPPCDGRWPVAGFVELSWGSSVRIERLGPTDALAALARYRRVVGLGAEFSQLLELVDRPVFRLSRPRGWSSSSEAAERLLEAVANAQ